MPVYVMFTRLTTEGRKSMMNNPQRAFEVNKEVEAMGAKVIAQYALLAIMTSSTFLKPRAMKPSPASLRN